VIKIADQDIQVDGRLLRIARLAGDSYKFIEDPEGALNSLKNAGTRVDLFTFMQRLPETEPKYSYPMEWDNFAAIPISTFDNWWTKQLGFKARNKAKQAGKKGVTVREVPFDDALVRGICEIYNECPVRQGRPFSHYRKDIEKVRAEEATFAESSVFLGAFLEEKLIGFVKLVSDDTGTQAGLMNIVSMIQHRDKAPTNALVAEAVRVCSDRGIKYLVYSNFAYGKKQPDSVADFKERNGFKHIDVPRYYVPLTLLGSAALRLGLHHRLVDQLPEPLIAKLRKLRNAWYNRKFQSATEAF
jgi:hypothetical protein